MSASPVVVLGEVRTCLLPSSRALAAEGARELLALVPGRSVRRRERPVPLAISPISAIGVECDLPTGSDKRIGVVGTVAVNAVLTGGRILQSSARTRVMNGDHKRHPWSHYISRIGVTEVSTVLGERERAKDDLVAGFLDSSIDSTRHLDLASVTARLLSDLRGHRLLDQDPPLRASITRLRWTALVGGAAGPRLAMRLDDEALRSVRIVVRDEADLSAVQRFCEDLAAHDWLLTLIADVIGEADRFGLSGPAEIRKLAPMLVHLAHLWSPGAHTPPGLRTLWRDLQNDPGFSRQWNALVSQIRDRIVVAQLGDYVN